MRLAAFAAVAALCMAPLSMALAQEAPPPQAESWSLEKVRRLGQAIYDQDVAAARGTDALLATLGDRQPTSLVGWIVVGEGRRQTVRFLARDGDELRAAYDIPVRNGRAGPVVPSPDVLLPPEQQAMFKARETAAANIGSLRCTPRYNAVVLNDPDGDGWLVWLLASTNRPNQLILAGHHRFRISADGTQVLRHDPLSATCIVEDIPQDQGQLAAVNVSHIVSSQPVETHVFTSLLYGLPLYVIAGGSIFHVDGARIRVVQTAQ